MFQSNQSKIILILGIITTSLAQIKKFDIVNLLYTSLLFLAIAYNANCLAVGNCNTLSWIIVMIPIVWCLIYIHGMATSIRDGTNDVAFVYSSPTSTAAKDMPMDEMEMQDLKKLEMRMSTMENQMGIIGQKVLMAPPAQTEPSADNGTQQNDANFEKGTLDDAMDQNGSSGTPTPANDNETEAFMSWNGF